MFTQQMLYGAAYYPEHWDRKRWATDVKLMKAAGFNVVRLAEFAWCFLEPREGVFEFQWLDEAIDLLQRAGIKTILGTPTATIPAWMAQAYPHVMAMDVNGHRKRFGVRKDYCVNQPDFDRLALRIVEQMARHYGSDPRVIAVQTDNEFGASPCRCPLCLTHFRDFLQERYETIDRLNDGYGTWFWGTRYDSFDQIDWPPDAANPGLALDAKRFYSQVDVDYQARQIAVLRKLAPQKLLTHNLMGLFSGLEYYKLTAPLDFASWDNYPGTATGGRIGAIALAHAVTWSFKRNNFLVMEQQSGPGGWDCYWGAAAPGETAMLAWQAIARGADGISYFRWRTSVSGQEQYWHGILNHDAKPRRRYYEIAQMGQALKGLSAKLIGTTPLADVGIFNSYEQIWATDIQKQNSENPVAFQAVMCDMAEALSGAAVDFGAFGEAASLGQYKIVLCPPLYLADESFASALRAYVRQGGFLVLTARSGVKDLSNRCLYETLPGPFASLAGVEVEEYDIVPKNSSCRVDAGGLVFPAGRIREHLLPRRGTRVLAVHRGGHFEGLPAVTRRKLGKGSVLYVGTLPDAVSWRKLLLPLLLEAGVTARTDVPAGLEVARRGNRKGAFTFVLNHTDEPRMLGLEGPMEDLLSGKTVRGPLALGPYGVAILNGRA